MDKSTEEVTIVINRTSKLLKGVCIKDGHFKDEEIKDIIDKIEGFKTYIEQLIIENKKRKENK